ncbi:LCP family protein [Enterococcus columbae]|uniref:Cell envelope-related transcriptional attenuator domain-containing protein n=1 Tax=Enterococcus columbae DSM 7374 = ATCC 51263 TaxID=1121865 RepID=S0KVP7_9ENTE|nr:LCP family protein [Enterococcus columbae]EOT44213.1 hypothetical protein OMW_00268 [Enterococcus columbae DSM 7374 = ATCC 51263]EOW84371.1 hypothetical protein I568_00866 [Enterococcus columbae DSM 7374 = ATCC 51263]OJG26070.1 hypothetical protein RR47_GL000868 [Enterococcus columbae DSM 7374 = ATCC 51263]
MKLYQKIIIAILSVLAITVTSATVWAAFAYKDANATFAAISKHVERKSTKRTTSVSLEDRDPITIALFGIDTGGLGRTEQGRSDTMMIVTLNPKEKKTTVVSLDRDIYTKIVGYDSYDKLNHAYAFGGVKMALDSIEYLLDVPIDHYVSINLQGLTDLIDAVGGIEVNNKIDFTLDGVHVPEGKQHLDGTSGLAYARMRKQDPEGDIGRQRRQREVVSKIVHKVLGLDGISKYKEILKAVQDNCTTNLTWDQLLDISKNYVPALENIQSYQLSGEEPSWQSDVYYQVLGKHELLNIQNLIKSELGLPTKSELTISDGYSEGYNPDQLYDDEDTPLESDEQTQKEAKTQTQQSTASSDSVTNVNNTQTDYVTDENVAVNQ